MIKNIMRIWNENFYKGVSVFQIFLMGCMILGAIINNQQVIMVSMASCLLGYFEPTKDRFSITQNRSNMNTDKEVKNVRKK